MVPCAKVMLFSSPSIPTNTVNQSCIKLTKCSDKKRMFLPIENLHLQSCVEHWFCHHLFSHKFRDGSLCVALGVEVPTPSIESAAKRQRLSMSQSQMHEEYRTEQLSDDYQLFFPSGHNSRVATCMDSQNQGRK